MLHPPVEDYPKFILGDVHVSAWVNNMYIYTTIPGPVRNTHSFSYRDWSANKPEGGRIYYMIRKFEKEGTVKVNLTCSLR
jgi:hypothetical protein